MHAGFEVLVLQRCVGAEGVSEGMRVAGLRAASAFMARSDYCRNAQGSPKTGIKTTEALSEAMCSKGDLTDTVSMVVSPNDRFCQWSTIDIRQAARFFRHLCLLM